MSTDYLTRIQNASQIVALCDEKELQKCGKAQDSIVVLENAGMVIGHDGNIVAIGNEHDIKTQYMNKTFTHTIDAQGKSIIPGLCDGHSHPVWSGDRVNEFKLKLAGASYMQIHESGGGIGYTVKCTRASPQSELEELLETRLDRMLAQGTTLLEAKSGYGLDFPTELKMLKVLHSLDQTHPIDIVSNYCGAHSVPPDSNAATYVEELVTQHLPNMMAEKKSGSINPTLIDVFCEKNIFTTSQSRRILEAGHSHGLKANFHGDELNFTGSAEMAGEIKATACSHLEHCSEAGMQAMAAVGTVAVLLPTTAYALRIEVPPARAMIEAGVAIALGTDFNPNAHCLSLPFVMNLACVTMRMTVNEALVAATLNAAASVNKSHSHGSLEVGKRGDFVILDSPVWEHVIYELVDPPIMKVFKNGTCVFTKPPLRTR